MAVQSGQEQKTEEEFETPVVEVESPANGSPSSYNQAAITTATVKVDSTSLEPPLKLCTGLTNTNYTVTRLC